MKSPARLFLVLFLAQLALTTLVFGFAGPDSALLMPLSIVGAVVALGQGLVGWAQPHIRWPAVLAGVFGVSGWGSWAVEALMREPGEPLINFFGLLVFSGLLTGAVALGAARLTPREEHLHAFRFALAQLALAAGVAFFPLNSSVLVGALLGLGVVLSTAQLTVGHWNKESVAFRIHLAGGYLAIFGYATWILASTFVPFAVIATLAAAAFEKMEK